VAWPTGRGVDGGIDRIPIDLPGQLWLCGKHAVGPDPDAVLARVDADTIVCLTERHELVDRYPGYVEWLDREAGGRALWRPVHDLSAPPFASFLALVDDLLGRLAGGEDLIVHCGAGIGRAGTTAVGILVRHGIELEVALARVAQHRPMAGPEVGSQRDAVERLAALGD
jgi:hypothetical protein